MTDNLSVPDERARFNDHTPNWAALIPSMFTDGRFQRQKEHRRRYLAEINGARPGIVTAWCPGDGSNFALNKTDVDVLVEFRRKGTFDAAYIVLATAGEKSEPIYVAHREALEFYEVLSTTHFRTGAYGD